MAFQPPPLPPDWPYPPRPRSAPAELRERAELPGLPGTWRLVVVPGLALEAPGAASGLAFGRGGILRAGDLMLRPYRRGGLVRHVNARLYPGPGRFRREFLAHQALWDAGAPTVEPLGWAARRRLWGWEGVYLTRHVPALPWPQAWERSDQLAPQLDTLLRALCAWGLLAPDLNATNLLLDAAGNLLALDWDRARWLPGQALMARYRARLARSLAKLGAPPEVQARFLS